ncbi:hypothetical protein DLAC_01153 [Tieghemostelium lacteum]|uniref:Uncharacterized protein n=1 Tax=Tieghemostelium lacteum TaxID=361077 RepID=A0A152A7W6_TIELA|nr:hypothetical protein DLAC_01153 [Tieghemostelium lacteum]|eukprot:KYR02322.1 hypothetical protein DLAC_01153 [Tieghemostelium lacteum]
MAIATPDLILFNILEQIWKSKDYDCSFAYKLSLGLICKRLFKYISTVLIPNNTVIRLPSSFDGIIQHQSNPHCIIKSLTRARIHLSNDVDEKKLTTEQLEQYTKVMSNLTMLKIESSGYFNGRFLLKSIDTNHLRSLNISCSTSDKLVVTLLQNIPLLIALKLTSFSINYAHTHNIDSSILVAFVHQQQGLETLCISIHSNGRNGPEGLIEAIFKLPKLKSLDLRNMVAKDFSTYLEGVTMECAIPLSLTTLRLVYDHRFKAPKHNPRLIQYLEDNPNLEVFQLQTYEQSVLPALVRPKIKRYITRSAIPLMVDHIDSVSLSVYQNTFNSTFKSLIQNQYKPTIKKLSIDFDSYENNREESQVIHEYLSNCPKLQVLKIRNFTSFDVVFTIDLLKSILKNKTIRELIVICEPSIFQYIFKKEYGLSQNQSIQYLINRSGTFHISSEVINQLQNKSKKFQFTLFPLITSKSKDLVFKRSIETPAITTSDTTNVSSENSTYPHVKSVHKRSNNKEINKQKCTIN